MHISSFHVCICSLSCLIFSSCQPSKVIELEKKITILEKSSSESQNDIGTLRGNLQSLQELQTKQPRLQALEEMVAQQNQTILKLSNLLTAEIDEKAEIMNKLSNLEKRVAELEFKMKGETTVIEFSKPEKLKHH